MGVTVEVSARSAAELAGCWAESAVRAVSRLGHEVAGQPELTWAGVMVAGLDGGFEAQKFTFEGFEGWARAVADGTVRAVRVHLSSEASLRWHFTTALTAGDASVDHVVVAHFTARGRLDRGAVLQWGHDTMMQFCGVGDLLHGRVAVGEHMSRWEQEVGKRKRMPTAPRGHFFAVSGSKVVGPDYSMLLTQGHLDVFDPYGVVVGRPPVVEEVGDEGRRVVAFRATADPADFDEHGLGPLAEALAPILWDPPTFRFDRRHEFFNGPHELSFPLLWEPDD